MPRKARIKVGNMVLPAASAITAGPRGHALSQAPVVDKLWFERSHPHPGNGRRINDSKARHGSRTRSFPIRNFGHFSFGSRSSSRPANTNPGPHPAAPTAVPDATAALRSEQQSGNLGRNETFPAQ